jgi:hypothetical protein
MFDLVTLPPRLGGELLDHSQHRRGVTVGCAQAIEMGLNRGLDAASTRGAGSECLDGLMELG